MPDSPRSDSIPMLPAFPFDPDDLLDLEIISGGREEESLFARDDVDALVRREKKTQDDFERTVTVTIDGVAMQVPQATRATDGQGNAKTGPDGLPVPRATTILDAAARLVTDGTWDRDELARRIPILCHQDHLTPAAVCRMCSVHVSKKRKRDGKLSPGTKLVPACQHEVQEGMIVTTRCGGEAGADTEKYAKQVERSTRWLAELLVADHRHPDPARDDRFTDELGAVAATLNVAAPRLIIPRNPGGAAGRNANLHPKSRPIPLALVDAPRGEKPKPYSSRTIEVDHDRCILCDRCARSCSEVRPFKVIGHTGKGYKTRISFDLDLGMNDSNCVQCGECMTACPTGALTLRRRVAPRAFEGAPLIPEDPNVPLPDGSGLLDAGQMQELKLTYREPGGADRDFYPFRTVPFAYLKWNEGAVRRRAVRAGDELCRQDDYGTTAFLLESGTFDVFVNPQGGKNAGGFLAKIFGGRGENGGRGSKVATVPASALILGELACLSNKPRSSTLVAATAGVVYEVTRNLLATAQRSPSARDVLDGVYRRNAVRACLRSGDMFAGLTNAMRDTAAKYLEEQGGAELRRVQPGELVIAQGDMTGGKGDFYVVRLGFVKVFRVVDGQEEVFTRLTTDEHFGEIALMADHPKVKPLLPRGFDARRRTASVAALDPVELVRVPGTLFRGLCNAFPDIADKLADGVAKTLTDNQKPRQASRTVLGEYLDQGLFQAQKVLALDLVSCTRCDECTRACASAHGDGHSRLLRDGLRFGDFLVATSCRSCHKPYCMDGCPVDAIHRSGANLEVLIDSHCIGCGLCATNCPYGAIQMVPKAGGEIDKRTAAVASKAVNCDLCHGLVPDGADPFCVAACPHDAAFRWDGETLLEKARSRGLV